MNKLTPKKIKHTLFVDGKPYIDYILLEDIPKEYKEEFDAWMIGQTCPVVYNQHTGKKEMVVYFYDWIRWYQFKTGKVKFLVFD